MKPEATLAIATPLAGWCLPLSDVPDPVFAQGLAGVGAALDPTASLVHAPCAGEVVVLDRSIHAITVRSDGGAEILVHVGIDTVKMGGAGFERLVRAGQRVSCGEPLLRFDLDLVANRAASCVTPVVVASGGRLLRVAHPGPLAPGDFLFEIAFETQAPAATASGTLLQRDFRIPFDHGLHARPAAQIAAALKPFQAAVRLSFASRSANARSTVSLMALGVSAGETVSASAQGPDAALALDALAAMLPVATTPSDSLVVPRGVPRRLTGVIAGRGLALGVATILGRTRTQPSPGSGDAAKESAALEGALSRVLAHASRLRSSAPAGQREIFSAHAELLQDPELVDQARKAIARGDSAGRAWQAASRAAAASLDALKDARLRERAADLRDLEEQVLRVLAGKEAGKIHDLPENAIVIADELLPSQLVSLDRAKVAGFCTARGGPTSHVAILAAALGIPSIVAAGAALLDIPEGTRVLVDAERGRIEVDPDVDSRAAFADAAAARARQLAQDRDSAAVPACTLDGTAIAVHANVGSPADAQAAKASGAEGCGLLRTEFLFLDRREAPSAEEQLREYQAIATTLGDCPLTIRTMDIGGDKPLAYLPLPPEENPALGLRGVRASLRHEALLREQLRAIVRVQPAGRVRILLPMVTEVAELRAVRSMLVEVLRDEPAAAAAPALGVMIETPACALLADQFAAEADFLSIGTNDLAQYTLAMDRAHPELAARLDGLHPAVLRLVARTCEAAKAQGRKVSVCGGLGADPLALAVLVGLGVREISAVPSEIPRIKRQVRSLSLARCEALALRVLDLQDAAQVRSALEGEDP